MSRVLRTRNPDGREWEVRVQRVRRPLVRASFEEGAGVYERSGEALVLIVLPLLVSLVDIPVRWLASFRSSDRWVEAVCWWPNEIRVSWATTRADARGVQRRAAEALAVGYAVHTIEAARYLGWSDPPAGVDDP